MKAAVLTATRRIEIRDVPIPAIGPAEVLIRVRVAGICGSEVHAFKGTHPFRKPPALPGHEVAGDVVEVGSAVLGSGTIGLGCIAAAREVGATTIVATARRDFSLAKAQKLGATHTVNVSRDSLVDAIRQATGGRGVDVAMVTIGLSPVANQALAAVKPRGLALIVALFEEAVSVEDPFVLIRGERSVTGSFGYTPEEYQLTLDLIAAGRISAGALVTDRLPLEAAQQGREILADRKEECIKVVLQVGRE